MSFFQAVWRQLRTFGGFASDASYLWPRWIVLRGVGLVYVIIFSGILQEGPGVVGPRGLARIAEYCAYAEQVMPNIFTRFLRVPSLCLVTSDPAMISLLQWGGLAAAVALVLNLWPRLALFVCWAFLLSFVSVWREFSSTLNDPLMLETALLCIPFAPAGFRPGLGTASPPHSLAVLMVRWLIIRIMLTAGLIKMFGHDARWLDFTFMERMYETSPAPTILGYYAYHLPHAWHVGEVLFTFVAEVLAPLIAIFGGRPGRWLAVATWTIFQVGIQLTGNFAWLNTAAITLGLLLLDDQMIVAGCRRLRLDKWAQRFTVPAPPASPALPGRRFPLVAGLLWLHFSLTIWYAYIIVGGHRVTGLPNPRTEPLQFLFRDFRSTNCYILYASTPPVRDDIEFAGSDDGGKTWRPYPFRYKPQREDRMAPFLAPRFGRFEATLQLVLDGLQVSLIPDVARALVEDNPHVIQLFASNPFPETPPTMVRMVVYRYTYTDLKTRRETGRYWNKTYMGDYAPPATAPRP